MKGFLPEHELQFTDDVADDHPLPLERGEWDEAGELWCLAVLSAVWSAEF